MRKRERGILWRVVVRITECVQGRIQASRVHLTLSFAVKRHACLWKGVCVWVCMLRFWSNLYNSQETCCCKDMLWKSSTKLVLSVNMYTNHGLHTNFRTKLVLHAMFPLLCYSAGSQYIWNNIFQVSMCSPLVFPLPTIFATKLKKKWKFPYRLSLHIIMQREQLCYCYPLMHTSGLSIPTGDKILALQTVTSMFINWIACMWVWFKRFFIDRTPCLEDWLAFLSQNHDRQACCHRKGFSIYLCETSRKILHLL